MFGLFNKKDPDKCPVSEENRIWIEQSFSFLVNSFGEEKIRQRKILVPDHSHFPISYTGDPQTAFDTLKIVADQMEVAFDEIHLDFFDHGVQEISTGSPFGRGLFLERSEEDKGASGLYWGKQEDGKYHIWLERGMLVQPENMVAALSHEIAHIKLLGEWKIAENDEKLTDLVTVIFGLGIFNANAAFQTYGGIDYSGWRNMGYLTQMEWGYALSLLAYIRDEKNPIWIKHLSLNVRNDFKQGEYFIANNKAILFQQKPPDLTRPVMIECPVCHWRPDGQAHWECTCGHSWNTFDTNAKCPNCNLQWEETGCPNCGEMSPDKSWYVNPTA